jgi:hypothetical protein
MGTGTGGDRTWPSGEAEAQLETSDPGPGTLRVAFAPHAGAAGHGPDLVVPRAEGDRFVHGPPVPRAPAPPPRIDPLLHANPARASPPR